MAIREINSDGSPSQSSFGMYHGIVQRDRSFDAIAVLRAGNRQ